MATKTFDRSKIQTLAVLGLLTAIVIVLQFVSMGLRFGTFSITLTLVPIVVGGALYGPGAGAWLGFVFGLIVLLSGDAAAFLTINAAGTIITVLLKGTAAGFCAALIYKLLAKKNAFIAVLAASIAAPVVNTGLFLIGCLVFFLDTVSQWAGDMNVGVYMITGLVGFNFIIELGTNLILNPATVEIIKLGKKQKKSV